MQVDESNQFHEAATSEKELNAFHCTSLKLIFKKIHGGKHSFINVNSIPIIRI